MLSPFFSSKGAPGMQPMSHAPCAWVGGWMSLQGGAGLAPQTSPHNLNLALRNHWTGILLIALNPPHKISPYLFVRCISHHVQAIRDFQSSQALGVLCISHRMLSPHTKADPSWEWGEGFQDSPLLSPTTMQTGKIIGFPPQSGIFNFPPLSQGRGLHSLWVP